MYLLSEKLARGAEKFYIGHLLTLSRKENDTPEGCRSKCFHNGIILIVNCFQIDYNIQFFSNARNTFLEKKSIFPRKGEKI